MVPKGDGRAITGIRHFEGQGGRGPYVLVGWRGGRRRHVGKMASERCCALHSFPKYMCCLKCCARSLTVVLSQGEIIVLITLARICVEQLF